MPEDHRLRDRLVPLGRRSADPGDRVDSDRRREVEGVERDRDPVAYPGDDRPGTRLHHEVLDVHPRGGYTAEHVTDANREAARPTVGLGLQQSPTLHVDHVADDDPFGRGKRWQEGRRWSVALGVGGCLARAKNGQGERGATHKRATRRVIMLTILFDARPRTQPTRQP
jgi:hypothetical protein